MKTNLMFLFLSAITQLQPVKKSILRVIIIGEGSANVEFSANCTLYRRALSKTTALEDTIEVNMPLGSNQFWVHFPKQTVPMRFMKADSLETIRVKIMSQ